MPGIDLLIALFAAGSAHAAEASPKIVNGEAESDFPAVVSLGADLGTQRFSMCTGSIITSRIVLTAAHCGEDIPPSLIVSAGRGFLGETIWEPDHVLLFTDMVLHPDYVSLVSGAGGNLPEYDVAVVILAEDSPVAPIRINLEPMIEDDVGLPMVSVGFGASQGSGAGSGTKRSADLLLQRYDEQFLYTNGNENPEGGNICGGDSGGPQLILDESGEWVQWAVHSWGYDGCRGVSASTRTDIAAEWILDQVEAVHGTRDLCEASGLYGDGSCDPDCEADPDCAPVAPPLAASDEDPGGCSSLPGQAGGTLAGIALLGLGLRRRR